MGFASGWKSAIQSVAQTIAQLVGQDIVAKSISLTQASGSDAVVVASGARVDLASADARSYLVRSASNTVGAAGNFQTGAGSTGSGIADFTCYGDFYTGLSQRCSIGYATGTITTDGNLTLNGASSKVTLPTTDSSGTPGNATIDKPSGRSAIAAGASSCQVTNSLVAASSRVFISTRTRDATGLLPLVTTVGVGSFTVTTSANCTANLVFDWLVIV